MDAFLQSYGLWIVLAGVFIALHWFGLGCGGGHAHGGRRGDAGRRPGEDKDETARPSATRGCH